MIRITRKLPVLVIWRARGLLNMLYRPSEISKELQVPVQTVRGWAKREGLPHQSDPRGRIWINGLEFAQWVERRRSTRPRYQLEKDEAYCMRCHCRVKLLNPVISYSVKPPLLSGLCPRCGGKVNRGVKRDLPS